MWDIFGIRRRRARRATEQAEKERNARLLQAHRDRVIGEHGRRAVPLQAPTSGPDLGFVIDALRRAHNGEPVRPSEREAANRAAHTIKRRMEEERLRREREARSSEAGYVTSASPVVDPADFRYDLPCPPSAPERDSSSHGDGYSSSSYDSGSSSYGGDSSSSSGGGFSCGGGGSE